MTPETVFHKILRKEIPASPSHLSVILSAGRHEGLSDVSLLVEDEESLFC